MIVRIVKLTLQSERIEDFKSLFNRYKKDIAASPGCLFLQGLQDIKNTNIFFTHSHWKDENALNDYRNSKLFTEVWSQAKEWFMDKPEAWSNKIL